MGIINTILKAAAKATTAKKPKLDQLDDVLGEKVPEYNPNEMQNNKNRDITEVNDKKSEKYKNDRLLEDEARGTHGTSKDKTKFNKEAPTEEDLDEMIRRHEEHMSEDETSFDPDETAPGRKSEKVPIDEEDQPKLSKARKKHNTSEMQYDAEGTVAKEEDSDKPEEDEEEEEESWDAKEVAPEDFAGRASKVKERQNKKYWNERQVQKASEADYDPNATATNKPVIERGKGYDEKAMYSTEPEGSIEMSDPSGITADRKEMDQSEELPQCLQHMKKLVRW